MERQTQGSRNGAAVEGASECDGPTLAREADCVREYTQGALGFESTRSNTESKHAYCTGLSCHGGCHDQDKRGNFYQYGVGGDSSGLVRRDKQIRCTLRIVG
jgi:hypothetical protein